MFPRKILKKLLFGLGTIIFSILALQLFFDFELSKEALKKSSAQTGVSLTNSSRATVAEKSVQSSLVPQLSKEDSLNSRFESSRADSVELSFLDTHVHLYNDQDGERKENVTFSASYGVFPHGCQWRLVRNSSNADEESYEYWIDDPKAGTVDNAGVSNNESRPGFWTSKQPESCNLPSSALSSSASRLVTASRPATLPTSVSCSDTYCVYDNLYYHNGRWYILVSHDKFVPSWRFCLHQDVTTLHIRDVKTWLDSVPALHVVPGDTMIFGFVHYTHPTAIGHWWEMLAPMFSFLKKLSKGDTTFTLGDTARKISPFRRPVDRIVLLHLRRKHLFEWVRTMLAVAVGVPRGKDLPPIYFQSPSPTTLQQITSPLEGVDRDAWYLFERAAIVRNVGFGAERTFSQDSSSSNSNSSSTAAVNKDDNVNKTSSVDADKNNEMVASDASSENHSGSKDPSSLSNGSSVQSPQRQDEQQPGQKEAPYMPPLSDAREFRNAVYAMAGLPPPNSRNGVPRTITFQRKRSDRRVLNERALLAVLRRYADIIDVVEYDGESRDSSLRNQLRQMYGTGLLVSVHTSNLANAPLLPPGSGVLELIQRNWASSGLDRFFFNQTNAMGDIRHTAWSAQFLNQTVFLDEADYHRIGKWSYLECFSEMCIESHTKVDLIVDPIAMDSIMSRMVKHLWPDGQPVEVGRGAPTPEELKRERKFEKARKAKEKEKRERRRAKEEDRKTDGAVATADGAGQGGETNSLVVEALSNRTRWGAWPPDVATTRLHKLRLGREARMEGGGVGSGPLLMSRTLKGKGRGITPLTPEEVAEDLGREAVEIFQKDLPWPLVYDIRQDPTVYAGLTHRPGVFF